VLPRDVIVAINVVDRFFPEITREASMGQNLTAVGNPKRTRSVIYANNDSSKKVTISVDQYADSSDASPAYEEAVQKSRIVPGFKPISAANLGRHSFIGTVTQGTETHIGLGSLDDALIVGATLVGYEPTPGNIAKLISLTRSEEQAAKAAFAETLLSSPKERIDALIQSQATNGKTPGITVAIANKGRVIYEKPDGLRDTWATW